MYTTGSWHETLVGYFFLRTVYHRSCRESVLFWNSSISINAHTDTPPKTGRAGPKGVRCAGFEHEPEQQSHSAAPLCGRSLPAICNGAWRRADRASASVQEVGLVWSVMACKFTTVRFSSMQQYQSTNNTEVSRLQYTTVLLVRISLSLYHYIQYITISLFKLTTLRRSLMAAEISQQEINSRKCTAVQQCQFMPITSYNSLCQLRVTTVRL